MGKLYNNDINKYKKYFDESSKLLGIDVDYQYIIKRNTEPQSGETVYSELSKPITQSIIIEAGLPEIESLKQLGWFMDTSKEQILVDFSVSTPNLQEGCRFKIRSNENDNQYKEYVIVKLSNNVLFPSCIKCLCEPILKNESTIHCDKSITYGQQDITSDDENYTFINDKPEISFF